MKTCDDPYIYANTPIDATIFDKVENIDLLKKFIRRLVMYKDKHNERIYILLTAKQFSLIDTFFINWDKVPSPRDGLTIFGKKIVIKGE